MIRFLGLTAGLFLLILTLSGAVLLADSAAAQDIQLLLPDDSCPAPCWYGIQVNGKDEQVHSLLNTLPHARDGAGSKEFSTDGQRFYTSYVIVSTRSDQVMQIMLDIGGQVNIGELFLQLGQPDCVRLASGIETRLIFFYADEQIDVFTDVIPSDARLSPSVTIRSMYYHPGMPETCTVWRGFTWVSE